MNMMQQETGDQKESGYGNVDFRTPTDDDEVTIPSHDRVKEVPDFPDIDIRDEQTLSNTQREDWLLPTEPLHGARPRQTGRERPPVIDNRPPVEATWGAANRKPGRIPLLSPGRPISMEEEVITPPRGGGGGRPAPEPQGSPREVRAVPNPFPKDFPEDSLRDGGLDCQKDIGSLVDMLVNTVARMQKDIATLREENCLLITISQVVQTPGGRRSRQRKCHGSTEQLAGNNIDRCQVCEVIVQ